jgi:hypothetical protein
MTTVCALADGDHREVPGQCRRHPAPRVPLSGQPLHEQQRRSVPSDDDVLAQPARLDEPARER